MWINVPQHAHVKKVWVTWRPPDPLLHYTDLYAGVYEFLREAPVPGRAQGAREYLASLLNNTINNTVLLYHSPGAQLQRDRIAWVRAWLREFEREFAAGDVKMQNIG